MLEIKVLGPGCPKCKTLEKITREAVESSGITATVTKVEEILEIMKYGILSTPALVINEKVVIKGYLPTMNEIREVILNYNE